MLRFQKMATHLLGGMAMLAAFGDRSFAKAREGLVEARK
jgi:hypothetical protein